MSDVLIVGGGLTGLLAARELALAGAAVSVLERGELAKESSWAGGGIISPLYPWRYPDPVNELAGWSQKHYEALTSELRDSTGVDPEYVLCGLNVLAPGDDDAALAWKTRFDAPLVPIDAQKAKDLEPELGVDCGGYLMPHVGQIRNPRLLQSLLVNLEQLGVKIQSHSPVQQVLADNGRVRGVVTPSGDMSADVVVVAGGAWSRQILEGMGRTLNIEPVRGQMLLYKAEPGLVRQITLYEGHYVIPRRDGRVLVGSTMERAGFDKSTTESAAQELSAAALKIIPKLANYTIERHWAGLRPGSQTGVPYISEFPEIEGLFLSTGHFRNGVVMGPASARLLGDLILKRPPIVDPAPYALD